MKFLLISLCAILNIKSAGQIIPHDFRLCLDNLGCDNIRITKDQLINAKEVKANFDWFQIKSITIYVGQGNYTDEIISLTDSSNHFSKETIAFFKKWIKPSKVITIVPNGTNSSDKIVEWRNLYITIVDEL